ncbi:hypothetical protein [Nocardia sp. NPDC052316]|uniref:hypothetical protein n=1 Tax=Nocardia sp. NPDC052316 TaxID=3364329 RepID=UPI0037CBCC68
MLAFSVAVVGPATVGVLAAPAHAAPSTAPELCSSQEEEDVEANAARCHAKRAASAAFRARKSLEYALDHQSDWVVEDGNVDGLKSSVAYAEKAATESADWAEKKKVESAAVAMRTAAGTAFSVAQRVAKLFGGFAYVPAPGTNIEVPVYFNQHGDAAKAASDADHNAGQTAKGTYAVRNIYADGAELSAIAAYKKAEWID